jgi:hypothetical protein
MKAEGQEIRRKYRQRCLEIGGQGQVETERGRRRI